MFWNFHIQNNVDLDLDLSRSSSLFVISKKWKFWGIHESNFIANALKESLLKRQRWWGSAWPCGNSDHFVCCLELQGSADGLLGPCLSPLLGRISLQVFISVLSSPIFTLEHHLTFNSWYSDIYNHLVVVRKSISWEYSFFLFYFTIILY